jgi:hypothetical protein
LSAIQDGSADAVVAIGDESFVADASLESAEAAVVTAVGIGDGTVRVVAAD